MKEKKDYTEGKQNVLQEVNCAVLLIWTVRVTTMSEILQDYLIDTTISQGHAWSLFSEVLTDNFQWIQIMSHIIKLADWLTLSYY